MPVLSMVVRMMLKEKERSRIIAVQMDDLKGLLDIRRMNKAVVRGDEGCRPVVRPCGKNGERQDCLEGLYRRACW